MSLNHLIDLIGELERTTLESNFYGSPGYINPLPFLTGDSVNPWRKPAKSTKLSPIGKDGFQVCIDVSNFKPNELNVKVVEDSIVVDGKHEEREDEHGYISRQFQRRYILPKGYDAQKVVSTLSSDGVLTVHIPKPAIKDKSQERIVQIQQTGPAHLNVKPNPSEDNAHGEEAKKEQQQ